ncbi:hypothetical protein KABACHOK_02420 [Brevundimonas phage vB_BpoS-Kabachok]|uniref:Uncharacterized protein n=1 Tax=Brevundimonas phage vB_BpoS-Kabachok TaxID=2948600 RepID=A0A9E7SJ78_9CAUD|nr:hypothetical protein KABACHOK_02420 [Brevundimonas phage vB_BpoS-Kabachok]
MTIRTCINARDLNSQLENLEACAENAPEGAYEDAKALSAFFGETFQHLRGELLALGLMLDNSDGYREFEAVLYGLIKDSNPDCTTFAVSEGFGSAMDGPARERVIAQAADNIAALRAAGVIPHAAA